MNERIEKLANIWANIRAEDDRLGITYTFSEKALEVFAELIVKECADHIMNSSDRYRKEYFADKILIHFGMK